MCRECGKASNAKPGNIPTILRILQGLENSDYRKDLPVFTILTQSAAKLLRDLLRKAVLRAIENCDYYLQLQ